jgi:molybdopterin converting factor subunit 1
MIRLLYFAWVRERIGVAQEDVPLEAPVMLGELIGQLAGRSAGHAAAFADRARLRAAINADFAGEEAIVSPGDEVALFPPVTGG